MDEFSSFSLTCIPIFVEIKTRCDNDGSGFLERGEFREVCAGLGIAKVCFLLMSGLSSDDNEWISSNQKHETRD